MPILSPTKIAGRVEKILVNRNRDADLTSDEIDEVTVTYAGFEGEAHGGLTRSSCSRVMLQYPVGTEIRNVRQITILSAEELAAIGEAMDLDGPVDPAWIGGNLMLSGIPQLTELPPSSRLIFEGGASLVVDMENAPCKYPGEVIEAIHPGQGRWFPKAARGHRGITAWVEREGRIRTGDRAALHIPPQRIYQPATGQQPA